MAPVTNTEVNAHRIADVLFGLETCPAIDFRVRTGVVRQIGPQAQGMGERRVVIATVDGAEHRLEPDEAEMVAKCLRLERAFPGARAVAQAFTDAVEDARTRPAGYLRRVA